MRRKAEAGSERTAGIVDKFGELFADDFGVGVRGVNPDEALILKVKVEFEVFGEVGTLPRPPDEGNWPMELRRSPGNRPEQGGRSPQGARQYR